MALQTWPATLPAPAQYTFGPRERRRVVASADDPPGFRRFARDALVEAQVRWVFTAQHMATFDTFFQSTLAIGARWFTIPLPGRSGVVSRAARFIGPPRVSHLAAGVFDVSATFEVRLYGSSTRTYHPAAASLVISSLQPTVTVPPAEAPSGIVLFMSDFADELPLNTDAQYLLNNAVAFATGNPVEESLAGLKIAIFGENAIYEYLNDYHDCALFSLGALEVPNSLDTYDLFIFSRDGTLSNDDLTEDAATEIQRFVTSKGNAGFIGEYKGSASALDSNSLGRLALGFCDGNADSVQQFDPFPLISVEIPTHPVVYGIDLGEDNKIDISGSHEFIVSCSNVPTAWIVGRADSSCLSIVATPV